MVSFADGNGHRLIAVEWGSAGGRLACEKAESRSARSRVAEPLAATIGFSPVLAHSEVPSFRLSPLYPLLDMVRPLLPVTGLGAVPRSALAAIPNLVVRFAPEAEWENRVSAGS